ncbi:MAG: polysulfide reductase NrfD [Ignavibacteria bacterium]|nr:polysulfide reductase NrfD [Ignavibacteria bacterium]
MTNKIRTTILTFSIILVFWGFAGFGYSLLFGLKSWGLNQKTIWGVEIVNFVFWIGNSHAGTLISAILFLFRQGWRISIHRIAETITIICIFIAALFPFIHLGRPWFFYWMFPIPNQTLTWANFKSPIIWDVVAVLTYALLSLLFWFVGILPDYKHFKINQNSKLGKKIFGTLSQIWTNTDKNWEEYKWTYNIMAGILAFVVVSVHSIVSFDFSVTLLPQWHSTMLPIFFVVGAIYSGIALVLLCNSLLTFISSFGDKISEEASKKLSKLLLTFSLILLYFYLLELFFVFYSQNTNEIFVYNLRFQNGYGLIFILMCLFIFILPQLFWSGKFYQNKIIQLLISVFVLIGMWLERYLLIIPVLSFDFVTKQSYPYIPTIVDFSLTFGSVGVFVLAFYGIGKIIPMIPKNKY